MTWTKLSDDFGDDCWTLSDAAFRLHVEGLGWSNKKLLDCRIPADEVQRFAKHPEVVTELTNCGWWSYDDTAGEFVIRHHAGYQRLAADVVRQQEVNSRNGARGGRPRKPRGDIPETQLVNESLSESQSESESKRDGTGTGTGSVPATQLERTTHLEEEQARTHTRGNSGCRECQRASVFGSSPCPDHREAS